MKVLSKAAARASTVRELLQFLWERKQWWLIPVVLLLLATTMLIALAQTVGVGRFIYPGF